MKLRQSGIFARKKNVKNEENEELNHGLNMETYCGSVHEFSTLL